MEVLRSVFAIGGLLICCLGLGLAAGVAAAGFRGARHGGIVLGLMMCLWWLPAAGASLALLWADAAVVALCLGLWAAGAPVVFGAGWANAGPGRSHGRGSGGRG